MEVLRPVRQASRPGWGPVFKSLRQIIESINQSLESGLDLGRRGGRRPSVCSRIAQRLLALAAAIWHKDHLATSIRWSLSVNGHSAMESII
jgi:hypothetical protein